MWMIGFCVAAVFAIWLISLSPGKTLKASGAVGIINRKFKALPFPILPFDAKATAVRLVAISINSKPEMFMGKSRAPHPLATAAVSLAGGLENEGYEYGRMARQCIFLALGNVLLEAASEVPRGNFTTLDMQILSASEQAYTSFSRKLENEPNPILDSLGL